jgi:hypothetical protein
VVPPAGEKAIAKELVNIATMLDDGLSGSAWSTDDCSTLAARSQ